MLLQDNTSTPLEESPHTQPQDEVTHNVTESDVMELESMQRDVQNIEELVQRKRKALEEFKKITIEEKKLRKEMRVSYVV